MNRYSVEKRAVSARVLSSDGTSREGSLFLSPFSRCHTGPQTVAEMMAERDHALPFQQADGRFVLLGKATVAAVRVPEADGKPQELLLCVRARLRVAGSHLLQGRLLAEAGAGERLTELLNTADEWICLEEEPGAVWWISKRHLIALEADEA